MTRMEIMVVVLGAVALVAVVLAARGGRPRVTQIDMRRDRGKDDADA